MILNTFYQSDDNQPTTKPFPRKDGWFFALRSGDYFSVSGSWGDPKHVYRDYFRLPRPFLSWRKGNKGFYIGWKAWGPEDKEAFAQFPGINPAVEVYPGSRCLQGFTVRFSSHIDG